MNEYKEKECWEIIHIPDKPPFPPHQQPTVNVYAAVIDPKVTNTIVRKLNQILPLENLRHVKRVRKQCLDGDEWLPRCSSVIHFLRFSLEPDPIYRVMFKRKPQEKKTEEGALHPDGSTRLSAILCIAGENDSQLDIIPQEVVELIDSYQLETFITKVCKYAPLSKEEWEEQSKIWPTSYHPPTYNISGITGFSEEESQSVCTFMKLALELAKCKGQTVNAAVIVDPSTNQVITQARDQVHSCSCSINHEVTTSRSLAYNRTQNHDNMLLNSSATEPELLNHGVSCLNPWQWLNQNSCGGSCSWHPLRHAAIVAIERSAARDRRLFPSGGCVKDDVVEKDHLQDDLMCPSSKKQKIKSMEVNDNEELNSHSNGCHPDLARPYLCTGYDIYLVWEPCAMCAMALVHQRVKRIFYGFPNPTAGALGSVHRLQGEKSLNHHYAVFKVMLPEEILLHEDKSLVLKSL